jgi:hypothetical protein
MTDYIDIGPCCRVPIAVVEHLPPQYDPCLLSTNLIKDLDSQDYEIRINGTFLMFDPAVWMNERRKAALNATRVGVNTGSQP